MKEKKELTITRFDNFDETNTSVVRADYFFNYQPSNVLKDPVGIKTATFLTTETSGEEFELQIEEEGIEVEGIAYFKQYFSSSGTTAYRIFIYGNDTKLYLNQLFMQDPTISWLYRLTFDTAPIVLAYKKDDADAIILASEEKMMVWKTGYIPYQVSDVPIISSMCMNEGVLFCTIQDPAFKVWYTTNLDAEVVGETSRESGYLSLEDDLGYARKVVTFNEDVYVFRDYGISRIRYAQGELAVSQIYSSNTLIYPKTVSVCGNYIIFMTGEGIYSYNGTKVSKTSVDISDYVTTDNSTAVASSLGENYYLALKMDFGDGKEILCEADETHVNNALIVVDVTDYSFQIVRGVDIKNLLPVKTPVCEKMLVCFNSQYKTKLGELTAVPQYFSDALPRYWLSENLFDNFKAKIVTRLEVFADKDVKFNLICDDKNISFTTFKSGANVFNFKFYCTNIKLEISSSSDSAEVKKVNLEYYEY